MEVPYGVWIGGLVTIFIFVITNLCVSIWWASRISTIVDTLNDELKDIAVELKAYRTMFASKEELVRIEVTSEKERKALWSKVDRLWELVNNKSF